MNLKNKVAVIAGASGGIGREIAKSLAREGTKEILIARRKEVLKTLKEEVIKLGGEAQIYECDLADTDSVEKVSKDVKKKYQEVAILVNAAGIGVYKPLEEIEVEEWQRSLEINVTAPFLLAQKLMSLLKKSEKAVVISLGSGMGKVGVAKRSPYCASKFALRGLMLSLAKEYEKTNIQFTLFTLGSVLTPFGPLSLEEKVKKEKSGKKYLDPAWLAHTIVSKIKNDSLEDEISIYPSRYFEESKKGKT